MQQRGVSRIVFSLAWPALVLALAGGCEGGGGGRGSVPDCACASEQVRTGLDWVTLPGGSFRRGVEPDAANGHAPAWDECPAQTVTLPGFELLRHEATVRELAACVAAGACIAPRTGGGCNWEVAGREEHPANCLSHAEAVAFCAWAGGRLPTEAEWEYAARAGGGEPTYPWGDEEPTCQHAVMAGDGPGCTGEQTQPVCSRPAGAGPLGLCDLAGNVWEWVADCYYYTDDFRAGYYAAPTDGSPQLPLPPESGLGWCSEQARVVRGGDFASPGHLLRVTNRSYEATDGQHDTLGVRCARDLAPAAPAAFP